MLLGNYHVFTKSPGRAFGGGAGVAGERSQFGKSGAARNRFTHQGYSNKSATPEGNLHPSAWVMPIRTGGMASRALLGSGGLVGSVAGGRNAEATLSGSGGITNAPLQLIVSASATLTGSGGITSADAKAILQAAATLSGSGGVTGTLEGTAHMLATLSGVGTVAAPLIGVGRLSADLTPFTELSPQSLADAVWNAVVDEYETQGTFGYATRFLYYLAHHKVVTDPVAGTFTVYDEDGTTVLFTADLYEDAAGATEYNGNGAERRERFT